MRWCGSLAGRARGLSGRRGLHVGVCEGRAWHSVVRGGAHSSHASTATLAWHVWRLYGEGRGFSSIASQGFSEPSLLEGFSVPIIVQSAQHVEYTGLWSVASTTVPGSAKRQRMRFLSLVFSDSLSSFKILSSFQILFQVLFQFSSLAGCLFA